MVAELLDGKRVAAEILEGLRRRIACLPHPPCIAFLRIGENAASRFYVGRKVAVAKDLGIRSIVEVFPEQVAEKTILEQLSRWNSDGEIDGILVQAPLPSREFQRSAFAAVDPAKDVDGFHPYNFGLLAQERPGGFIPCTPKGILRLLEAYAIPTDGRHAVIVGRSLIVGRPLSLLLQSHGANATVTVCHSRSQQLRSIVRSADILISAAGQPNLILEDMVAEGTTVVDVGQNSVPDETFPGGHRLCGDVDFPALRHRCSHLTPVPGGVGPMTVAMLMENAVEAVERKFPGNRRNDPPIEQKCFPS
ncbi:MAG: bifunctional 5,10-methylenetetrahydrofolate dehydrogenase/5,10-methenyltetrahydrofolate cyclohydrolase [Puniceicoccales bacterium]|nr:bifunctional 5,10-methylenetetrahydrofolate dehydrogenase/5,10-methenyltetrahydrofolate cyclohydrolase [Puniceicoccales bacterium]